VPAQGPPDRAISLQDQLGAGARPRTHCSPIDNPPVDRQCTGRCAPAARGPESPL